MTLTLSTHLFYMGISLLLSILVGNVLAKSGKTILKNYFGDKADLAEQVNRLIMLGFYLLIIGYISLSLYSGIQIKSLEHMVEILSYKIGIMFLVLAGFYLSGLWIMLRFRKRKKKLEDYILSS